LIEQLRKRLGEVAEHRAARWLEELERVTRRSARERLIQRIEEAPQELAVQWLRELDARLCWLQYRQEHDDFCYGLDFGRCEDCKPFSDHEGCPNYEWCKSEYEAEWPHEQS